MLGKGSGDMEVSIAGNSGPGAKQGPNMTSHPSGDRLNSANLVQFVKD